MTTMLRCLLERRLLSYFFANTLSLICLVKKDIIGLSYTLRIPFIRRLNRIYLTKYLALQKWR